MTQLSLEKKWLQKGLTHPGGMIPLLTEKGEPVDSKLIEKAFLNGWIELLPSARDGACFIGCRLTQSGRDFLDKGASAVETPEAKSPVSQQERRKQGISESAALLLEMLRSSKSRLAATVAEKPLPASRAMSKVFLLSLIPAVGLSIYMLYPSQPEPLTASARSAESPGGEATRAAAAPEQSAPAATASPSAGQAAASPAGVPVAGQEGYWQNIVSLMMNDRTAEQGNGKMPAQEGAPETASATPAENRAGEVAAARAEQVAAAAADVASGGAEGNDARVSVALPPEKPEIAVAAAPEPVEERPAKPEAQIALALPEPAAAEAPDLPPEAPAAPAAARAAAPGMVPEAHPAPSENTVMELETPPGLPVVELSAAELPASELPASELPTAESPSVEAAAIEPPAEADALAATERPAVPAQLEEVEPAQASPQPEEQPAEPPMEMASQEPEPAPSSISVLETEPAALAAADTAEAEAEAEGEAVGETGLAQSEAEAPAIADAALEGGEEAQAVAATESAANSAETIQLAEAALEETPDAAGTPEPSAMEREPQVAAQPEVSPEAGPDTGFETVVASATLEAPAAQEDNAPQAQRTPAGGAVGAAVLTIDREQHRSEGLPTEPESGVAASSDGSIERAAAPSVTDWTPDRSIPALEENRQAPAESSDEMSASDEAAAANAGSSALRQVQLAILPPPKPAPPEELPATTLAAVPEAATETGLPSSGYTVQFVSLDSEQAARKAASALTAKLGGLLGPRSLYVIKAQVSGKTYYRVRVMAEMTREEAGALCQDSKIAGQDCFVSGNGV
jgi:hypothetical protein